MAQVRLIVGNLRDTVSAKASKGRKNPCTRLCEQVPFLVCPCSLYGIAELLSGNILIYMLSLFSMMGVCGLLYAQFFSWNSTIMDGMIGIAFVGPLWVTCSIAPKVQFSGVKGVLMTDIDYLQRTNRKIGKKIENYRKNIAILKTATKKMTKGRRKQRTTVKKSDGISKRLKKENKIIRHQTVKLHENVKSLENWGKSLPDTITDFERRVDLWLTDQMILEYADEDIRDSHKVAKKLTKNLKQFPRRLEAYCVEPMQEIQSKWEFVGRCSKDLPFLGVQMQEAYNQFADLVKLQEMSFCQSIAYDIRTHGNVTNFGQQEYNLFFDRLPTYLADVVIADDLTFRKYTTNRVGFARRGRTRYASSWARGGRFISQAGMKRLIEDIVDGVSKIDQCRGDNMMPDQGGMHDISRYLQNWTSNSRRSNSRISNSRIRASEIGRVTI